MSLSDRLHAIDRFQQRRRRLSFVAAVIKKFSDDGASQLAALIAYYGFFSLFPLLLVFVTVLGFVLQGNASAQESVLHSTLSQFPVIGNQLQSNVHSLKGSGVALAIGLIGSLLAGLGITGATQNAFNQVWYIPHKRRPNFLTWRLRGLALLVVLGVLFIVSTAAAGYVSAQTAGAVEVLGGILIALALNLLLFFLAFRAMTSDEVRTRDSDPRRDRRGRAVADPAARGRLLRRPRGAPRQGDLGPVRVRAGVAHMALPRGPADAAGRRDQRRARPPAVATQLLLGPAA